MSDAATLEPTDTETGNNQPGLRVSASGARSALLPAARKTLTNLLLAKSVAEALLVAALAVGFYYLAFNPFFRGTVDVVDAERVAGWAVDDSQPDARVEVQLYVDDHFVSSRLADEPRPDVLNAGRAADERHGFVFVLPTQTSGEHEARIYTVHASGGGVRRTLQILGRPIRFNVTPQEAAPVSSPEGEEKP
ncbi:MAG: hypothetical protein LC754_16680 [Acidobacteria bacterium]|nr:hypothetical protein [Acidobacteriota bacterium]